MKTGFKLALITLPIAAIGAGILALVVSNSPPPERVELAERANTVSIVTAETRSIIPKILGFGVVAPAHTFDAIAEVGGTVDYVNPRLRDGQILPEGAVLLRLSPTDFNLAIAQANANIRAAEARLTELDVSEANQRIALEIEREVLAVRASDLARAEKLFTAGTLTQTARDTARAAHLAQRQKVQGIEGTLALFPTQRAVQSEQISIYQSTLTTAERNLERSELRLPITARVAEHNVEVGQFLKVGQTAASLDGIDNAEIEVQVSINALHGLVRSAVSPQATLPLDPTRMSEVLAEMNLNAEVHLRLGNEVVSWPARVDRLADGIDQKTGMMGVIVQVEGAYGQTGVNNRPPLTKGMFVNVTLGARPVSGIVLPRSALRDGKVYLADPENRLRIITATPQLIQGGIALFSDTIAEGSRIVLAPPNPVIDGLLLDPVLDAELIPQLLAEDAAQ
ncbi:hypothetical protein MWU76_17865 [Gelidibacter sp. F2691]|nr:hypothetical protein [Gelidibacter sp. F2691]